jgi:hypothetical protein
MINNNNNNNNNSNSLLLDQNLTITTTGAGIYREINKRPIFKKSYPLGETIEVYDSKL